MHYKGIEHPEGLLCGELVFLEAQQPASHALEAL